MKDLVRRRHILSWTGGLAAAPLVFGPAFAWPEQPIRLVVPFTPAGGPDFIARFVADRLSAPLGQPVAVENMPGARGNIGSQQEARAKQGSEILTHPVLGVGNS